MPQVKKQLFKYLLFALIATTLVLLPRQTFAAPWFNPTTEEHQAALQECVNGEVGLECTVQAIVTAIFNSLGEDTAPSPVTGVTGMSPGGIQFAGNLITTLVANPPISSGHYIDYIAQKLNPVQQVYAQGTGFRALSGFIPIWSAFRNMAYLAFVVIFIFIGFMIMFRARLDPQTVISVQNSLPNLVITLLLVTFSYAIAGFMVDLIYLGIFLAVSVLASQGLLTNAPDIRESLLSSNVFTLASEAGFFRFAANISEAITDVIQTAVDNSILETLYGVIPFKVTIGRLIISIAIIFSLFKLFFQLLMAYVNIILATILSPLIILFNALPGSQSFGNWLRNFLSNILIFPAIAMLFLISAVLIGRTGAQWQTATGVFNCDPADPDCAAWTPPFLGIRSTREDIMAIIGLGFILFAPQMVSVLQKALKAQPLPISGVFASIAAGATMAGGVARVAATPFTAPGRAVVGGVRGAIGGFTQQIGETLGGERPRSR